MTGVIVRERETTKDDPLQATSRDGGKIGSGTSQRETDYQVGRRVAQVVSQPGSIRSLQVLAVIKVPMDAQQLEQTRALISAAVGASRERGDVVVVQSLNGLLNSSRESMAEPPMMLASPTPGAAVQAGGLGDRLASQQPAADQGVPAIVFVLAGMVVVVLLALLAWTLSRGNRRRATSPLTGQERQAALARMRHWMAVDSAPSPGSQGAER